jgi:hypothetical protein
VVLDSEFDSKSDSIPNWIRSSRIHDDTRRKALVGSTSLDLWGVGKKFQGTNRGLDPHSKPFLPEEPIEGGDGCQPVLDKRDH